MIVDAHTMAGGNFVRADSMGFSELFAAMDKIGVDVAVVTSLRALRADARKGNEYLFSLAAGDPRIIPIGVVYPNAAHLDLPDLLADCVANGAARLALYLATGPSPCPPSRSERPSPRRRSPGFLWSYRASRAMGSSHSLRR